MTVASRMAIRCAEAIATSGHQPPAAAASLRRRGGGCGRFGRRGKENRISRRRVFDTSKNIENVTSTKQMPAQPADGDFRNRPRRRGAALEQAILDAAWEELTQAATDFMIEGVAARAQTGKQATTATGPGEHSS